MNLKKCPKCGQEVFDNANFCHACGCPMTTENAESKVVIYGTTQGFIFDTKVKVFIGEYQYGAVGRNDVLEVPITKPTTILFKGSFRRASISVPPGKTTRVQIVWDRITGRLLPQIFDNLHSRPVSWW